MRSLLAVLNPSSHDFEAARRFPELRAALELRAELDVVETAPDEAESRARLDAALARRPDRVLAIGGDGTVHFVVNRIMGTSERPQLAVIPFGTANDVAKSLRLPLADLSAMAAIATGDALGRLDVGRVIAGERSTYFIDSVTIGMDADVLAARGRYRELGGYLAYAAAMAARSLEQQSLDVRVEVDGHTVDARVFNIIVNNVPVYAGELELPGSARDDGLLDVYLFNRREYGSKLISFALKQVDVLKLGVSELLEDLVDNQRSLRGREVKLRLASPRRVQVDGELFGETDELRCEIAGELRVAVPTS